MGILFTSPIEPIQKIQATQRVLSFSIKRQIDSKIQVFVLEKIGEVRPPSFLPIRVKKGVVENKKRPLFKPLGKRPIPIGLRCVRPQGWINAWIQFFIYLPGMAERIYFAPRQFDPFREFIDQYFLDQQESRAISQADSASLLRSLMQSLSPCLFQRNEIDLFEIFQFFFREIDSPLDSSFHSHLSHLIWHTNQGELLDEAIEKKLKKTPRSLLVSLREDVLTKRQFILPGAPFYYDLQAFVEVRPETARERFTYVAYIKVEGSWYQCDDERITVFLSPMLSVPLQRSRLLFYKRNDAIFRG